MINDHIYYEQENIWGNSPEKYQVQVLFDIIDILPKDVSSILDVGCGDGHITNLLPKELHVVGADISEEALKYVTREKVVASIDDLPFPDNFFDLVMINDVLEHLPIELHNKGLIELQRVAKNYILITVPHNEQIEANEAKCGECNFVYHIHWHQRFYNEEKISRLIENENWKLSEVRYSGDVTLPLFDPTISLKRKLNIFNEWEGAVCPNCGSTQKVLKDSEADDMLLRTLDAVRHNYWFSDDSHFIYNNRSEIMALYKVKEKISIQEDNEKIIPEVGRNLCKVDFTNKLQCVDPDFTISSEWARFILPANVSFTSEGIYNTNPKGGGAEVSMRFPVISRPGDYITITVTGREEVDKFSLYGIDGITGEVELLFETTVTEKNKKIKIPINCAWSADKFGLAISLYLYGNITIHEFVYHSLEKHTNIVPFLKLEKGQNVLKVKHKDIYRSWGLWVKEGGLYPKPTWLYDSFKEFRKDGISLIQILQANQQSQKFLKRKVSFLNAILEDIEGKRSEAVNTLEGKEAENIIVKGLLEEKEQQRSKAEDAYYEASKSAERWKKISQRRVQKVLVLSHMFPHPEQRLSGPFVHEQVKALREYEEIDARVISCRPYWLNGINPFKILKAFKHYPIANRQVKWTDYEGVPVLYPYYRVGVPLIPFHFHAWLYSSAVMSVIERVWKEFKFDAIHAHTGYLDGNAALKVSEKFQVPFVITEHTGPFTYLTGRSIIRQLTLNAIQKADRVWCVSDALANEVKSYYSDEDTINKIDVLYNGVSTSDFYYQATEQKHKKEIQLVYVGFLEEVKDPLGLIEAFYRAKKEVPNISLKIVGDGSLFKAVEERIKDLGLQDSCKMLGLKPRSEVARIMREECDIFVLPSKVETFGVVLIEAMASGKPSVATRCGGPESIIKEDFLGELCEKENPVALSEAILKVIKNIDLYEKEKISAYARENFSYRVLSNKICENYQHLNGEKENDFK
ncbi:glycosyltransferase [Aneurinibacillus sp. REN35]|uniref:glycosyltransferase n=1 Tax=Aneurinibacillus sp. REN35 TaxID=3237286 RepID=UPI003529C30B